MVFTVPLMEVSA